MRKHEYMNRLARKLAKLPKEDYDRAMDYFEEYFAEAGEERTEQAMEDLGTPEEAAEQIIREFAVEKLEEETAYSPKKSMAKLWIIALAVLASPIALPLGVSFLIVGAAGLLCIVVFLLCIGLAAVLSVAAAVMSVIGGLFLLVVAPADGLAVVGMGIAIIGIALLAILATAELTRLTGNLFRHLSRKIIRKGGKEA